MLEITNSALLDDDGVVELFLNYNHRFRAMGNNCCRIQLHGAHQNKRLVNKRSGSSVSPSGNTRSGNPGLPTDQDVRHSQMTQGGVLTTPSKIQKVHDVATANQADESNIIKGDQEKDASAACKTNELLLIPEYENENDEEICPTCLDGYDQENPKIMTKCKHHYHLSCIFEWKERSDTCPVCDQVMVFEETSLV